MSGLAAIYRDCRVLLLEDQNFTWTHVQNGGKQSLEDLAITLLPVVGAEKLVLRRHPNAERSALGDKITCDSSRFPIELLIFATYSENTADPKQIKLIAFHSSCLFTFYLVFRLPVCAITLNQMSESHVGDEKHLFDKVVQTANSLLPTENQIYSPCSMDELIALCNC